MTGSVFQGFDLLPFNELSGAEVICKGVSLDPFCSGRVIFFPRKSVRSRTVPSANEQT